MYKFEAFYDENTGLTVIANVMTFGCKNNRDIVRRLMSYSDAFCNLTFADALKNFKTYDMAGLVKRANGFVTVYHDAN